MSTIPTPSKRRRWVTPVIGTTALLFGVGIGAAGSSGEATADAPDAPTATETITASPEPAPTVTETAEPEVITETETVTEEVEVEVEVAVTPDSCLSALDAGDESIDLLSQGIDIAADAMYAASIMDVAGIESANAQIEALTPQLEEAGFDWGFWSEACKEG